MGQRKYLTLSLCAVLAASLLNGCGSTNGERPKLSKIGDFTGAVADLFRSDPRSESDPTAAALYQDGIDYFERGRYARSISFFQRLRDDYPFSKEAEDAELKIAEAYYLNEDYAEATETYKNYLTFQPTGRHTHFVKYQLGRVNLDQFTGIDRDLEKVRAAKRYFESVIADHPESEHVPDARKKLAEARIHLAQRELYVGNFYLKERKYRPARERFENILRDYPDTPAAPKAIYALGDAHRLDNNGAKAATAYRTLVERYPDDPLAAEARAELAGLPAAARDSGESLLTPGTSTGAAPKPEQETAARTPEPPQFITKEGYVDEDPDAKKWHSYLNPFSWGGDEKEPEEENVAARQPDPDEEPTVAGKVTGFFDRLNPFSSSEDDKKKETEQPGPAETASVKTVVEEIDKTLGTRGSPGEVPTPPVSALPPEEKQGPPPADPSKVLGEIDSKLGPGTGPGDTPTPPAWDPALFSVRKPKEAPGESPSGTQSELLEGIDKQLRQEGIGKPGDLPRPPASRP